MFEPPKLRSPGLFVTGTDTEVGKSVISCALASALRRQTTTRVGVCKPLASGCRRDREGLVSPDAEALAHFADCRQPLDVINPIRFAAPLAPAVAAEQAGPPIDWPALPRALERLDAAHGSLLVEGVGGLLVPLDPAEPRFTTLELIALLGYPVVVVARSVLGTLNHTAMTVGLLRQRGCRVAGVVMNGYDADGSADDPSITSNRVWIERMTRVPVLAVVPKVKAGQAQPHRGLIDGAILDAVSRVDWPGILDRPQPVGREVRR
ncbi:MAG: dethiobiotin synthase [Planctomycetes bacterium]|nr:dethiobiotin synthase [Planctomycetota bacterium]